MKKLWPLFFFLSLGAYRLALAQETISEGLTLKIPSQGARNWGQLFKDDFATPISSHDHSGGGKGKQLTSSAFPDFTFDDRKIRLRNNQTFKARDAANSANYDLLSLDTSDILRFYHTGANTRADLGLGASDAVTHGSLTLGTPLPITQGGTGAANVGQAQTNLGFGALATKSTINNGDWNGTVLAVVNGGTGGSSAASARTNLGLGTMAVETATNYLTKAGNLSGIADAATARGSLGLGTMAVEATTSYLTSSSISSGYLSKSGNLSGITDAGTARTNISAAAAGNNSDITSLSSLTSADYNPTMTAQAGTLGSVSRTTKRYTQMGSLGFVSLAVAFVPSVTATYVDIALPSSGVFDNQPMTGYNNYGSRVDCVTVSSNLRCWPIKIVAGTPPTQAVDSWTGGSEYGLNVSGIYFK